MQLQDWVTFKDAPPPPEKFYLVAISGRGVFMMYYGLTDNGTFNWYDGGEIIKPYMSPDYWTNVPEMPKMDSPTF